MSKTTKQQQTDAVAAIEATLHGFERQRDALLDKQTKLADKRREVAFDAHNGDAASGKLLDGLHREAVELQSRLDSLADAIREAERRLHQTRQHAARTAERAKAKQLRETLDRFKQAGLVLDKALEAMVWAGNEMRAAITEMNQLGCSHPSHAQLESLGALALRTALTQTPWVKYFERISPVERKSFAGLVASWSQPVERAIAARLGDKETETEAA
jgi:hypothetical protein